MGKSEIESRKRWAQDRIAELRAQLKHIGAEIERHEDFIRLLAQSDSALTASERPAKPAKKLTKESPLVAYLRAALRDSGSSGLLVEQITNRVTELGYKPKAKTPARIMISTELARRSKNPDSGIVKVAPGRYAPSDQAKLSLVEHSGG